MEAWLIDEPQGGLLIDQTQARAVLNPLAALSRRNRALFCECDQRVEGAWMRE